MRLALTLTFAFFSASLFAIAVEKDSLPPGQKARQKLQVNQCTPWDHLKCIYITGKEVYQDGREGKASRHWWTMSYIGRACKKQHGKTFGNIFEAVFAVPHYIGVALGNGIGILVFWLRGPENNRKKKSGKNAKYNDPSPPQNKPQPHRKPQTRQGMPPR